MKTTLLASTLALLATASHASIISVVSQDFGGGGTGFNAFGSASNPAGLGQITPATNNQNGRIGFDQTLAGTGYQRIAGSFDFRAQPGGVSNQADGFSLVFLSTSVFNTTSTTDFGTLGAAEFGETNSGFGIGFNNHCCGTSAGGTLDTNNNSVYLSLASGTSVTQQLQTEAPFDFSTSEFNRASFIIQFVPGGADVSLSLIEDINGISGGPEAPASIYSNQFVPGLNPFDTRLGFVGRTGGQNALQQVDNVNVFFMIPEPSKAMLGLIGLAGTLLVRRRQR